MNELFFNWRKSLNLKKVIIAVLVIITLILLIIFVFSKKDKDEIVVENNIIIPTSIVNVEKNTTTFFNNNQSISVELSNNYNLKQYIPNDGYILELRSINNLNLFLSTKDIIPKKGLRDVVLADRLAYTKEFENISNLSEVKELLINDNMAFTYSFHYLDTNLNETFYIQITWLEINGKYFIFDTEFPLNDLEKYTNFTIDALSSFKLL